MAIAHPNSNAASDIPDVPEAAKTNNQKIAAVRDKYFRALDNALGNTDTALINVLLSHWDKFK